MEEDTEVLDWGNEDDESHAAEYTRDQQKADPRFRDARNLGEDEDDAVSLGDDEDEDMYPYKPTSQDDSGNGPPSTPRASSSSQQTLNGKQRDDPYERSSTPHKPPSRQNDSSELRRTHSLGKMTHALPPKPVVAPPPFIHPTPTPLHLARAMVAPRRDKKSNGHGKPTGSSQSASPLLPDWEERWPSGGGREPYYYNVRTHASQWQRPEESSSGMSSPDKEEEAISHELVANSPIRKSTDNGARGASRRDGQRRSSPDAALSYEDRHYRPGGDSPPTGSDQNLDRRDSYAGLPPRPVSPRQTDARRSARSLTPPPFRRDSPAPARAVRPRRERSPPPPDRGGRRERSNSQIESQERSWVPRNVSPPPVTTGRPDSRALASRGRHERPNAQPLPHPIATQGSRSDTSEWSASRPRSPHPSAREASPPRRYALSSAYAERDPSPPTRQKSRYDRPNSPVHGRAPGYAEVYTPADSVPHRRVRENDDYDMDVKRRRVDRSPSPRAEDRASRAERPTLSSHPDASDSSRPRKRQPLPPQEDRFREVSRTKRVPEIAPIPHKTTQQSGAQQTRTEGDRDAPARGAVSSFADVPSGPRSQAQLPPPRDLQERSMRDAPIRSGGRVRSRFDTPAAVTQPRVDVMDVDPPPLSRGASGRFDDAIGRSASSGSLAERGAENALPRGPRAMLGGPASQTPPTLSPSTNFRPLPPDPWQRAPPPHLKQDPPPMMPRSHSTAAVPAARGFDDYPLEPRQTRMPPPTEPRAIDRDLGARPGRRVNEPLPKFSGVNNVVIPDKRSLPPRAPEGLTGGASDRYAAPEGRGRYDDNRLSPRSSSYQSASPAERYRPLPPVNEPGPWQGREEVRKIVDRHSPPPSNHAPIRPPPLDRERQSTNPPKERVARPTRFGPERPLVAGPTQSVAATDEAPREWITREDAQRSGLTGRIGNASSLPPIPPPAPAPRSREQPRRPDYDAHIDAVNGKIDVRDDGHAMGWGQRRLSVASIPAEVLKRPSLEGRLSSAPPDATPIDPYHEHVDWPKNTFRDGNRARDLARSPTSLELMIGGGGGEGSGAPSGVRVHMDRLRLIDPQAPGHELALLPPQPVTAGRGNPVKIRRRGRSPEREREQSDAFALDDASGNGWRSRAGSLLARIATGPADLHAAIRASPPPPSLRERVDAPVLAPGSIPGLPPRPMFDDEESPTSPGGRGLGGSKRRGGKVRRGGRR